ncbi:VOC family protein [Sphingomonas sp. PL-96]|uniref:VOC family protein n=1 Tax=Sphingomonas sp. PL-96 TaxID=2887201 RepID=UPI001E5DF320|nr:VOC family protein [Sphingomonas sp. PL-96]MCC2976658.1 VOC family protein [Sphingomonas sp. PL-96]
MFNHIVIGTNDIQQARTFYDAVLETLGVPNAAVSRLPAGPNRLFYRHGGMSFIVTEPLNGEPATAANGGTIAFRCDSADQVQQFHDVAIAHGGLPIEDAPGVRHNPVVGDIYAAYVRDPDGNKLSATHRMASNA